MSESQESDASAPTNAPVGVVVVGHGESASRLVSAARGIVQSGLEGVVAVDAGGGLTDALRKTLARQIAGEDRGRGVLLLVDLLGSSPCNCCESEGAGHDVRTLGGLNLAMLIKLATADRYGLSVSELAEACAESGRRAVSIRKAEE